MRKKSLKKTKRIIDAIYKRLAPPLSYARYLGVKTGKDCKLIGHPNWGSEPWLIEIGNHVEISGLVNFITHDGSTWVFRRDERYKGVLRYGRIKIGDNCFIGMGTTILPDVAIGNNCIIGACSVVTKDVPEGSVYAGVPARFICKVEDFAEKCLRENPTYDRNEYLRDKRGTVLSMLPEK